MDSLRCWESKMDDWNMFVLKRGGGVLFCAYNRGMFSKGRIPFKKHILKNDAFKVASF